MSKPVHKRVRIFKLGRISRAEGSAAMRVSAEHLVDAVSSIRIRSSVEKLSQMGRRNIDGSLDGFLQQAIQREDPVRFYAVLLCGKRLDRANI